MEHRDHYQAYLIRLWLVDEESKFVWRASLENAHTGERQGFATLAKLLTYLESHMEEIRCEAGLEKRERDVKSDLYACASS